MSNLLFSCYCLTEMLENIIYNPKTFPKSRAEALEIAIFLENFIKQILVRDSRKDLN